MLENKKTEQEVKILVTDISDALNKIRSVGEYSHTEYIRDIIFGEKETNKKVRLRVADNFETVEVDATHKYRVSVDDNIKKEIEEILYKGSNYKEALRTMEDVGVFVEENSYEKIRNIFKSKTFPSLEIVLDIYPFGALVEIEGDPVEIKEASKAMGFSEKSFVHDSADDLYLKWIKKNNVKEMWDVRFGLTGEK